MCPRRDTNGIASGVFGFERFLMLDQTAQAFGRRVMCLLPRLDSDAGTFLEATDDIRSHRESGLNTCFGAPRTVQKRT